MGKNKWVTDFIKKLGKSDKPKEDFQAVLRKIEKPKRTYRRK
jgi:hypothetical protein